MSEGYKRAALSIYGLADADRQWLLSRLPAAEGEALQNLIGEISSRGLQRISGWRQLIAGGLRANKSGTTQSAAHGEGAIEAASAQEIRDALEQEPDWVIAVIMAHRTWPWTAEYLTAIEQHRRLSIARYVKDVEALKPTLRDTIVELLETKLRRTATKLAQSSKGAHFDNILRDLEQGSQAKKRRWRSLWSR
jgi:hypothetical protein